MAVDFLLKFDDGSGIKGESEIDGHSQEVQVMSWSWGGSMQSSVTGSGGSSAGKASLAEFSFMKLTDKATPPIFKALVSGTHIKQVDFFALKMTGGKGELFEQLTFSEVFITSYQVSGSSEIPTESVSFSYSKVQQKYWAQNAQGTMSQAGDTTIDQKTNKIT